VGGDPSLVDENSSGKEKLDRATKRRALIAMIWRLDQGIGHILEVIDQKEIRNNTIVWFSSDNGGISDLPNNNTPLRGNKLDVFEGGVRVPACVRWPARWPGKRTLRERANAVDMFPTLLAAAGGKQFADDSTNARTLDGIDLGSLFRGEKDSLPSREMYHYHGQPGPQKEELAITTSDWKLVVLGPQLTTDGPTEMNEVFLFKMPDDELERKNVAQEYPEIASSLIKKVIAFRALQPDDGVPPYRERNEGFIPPENWRLSPNQETGK
jgi:arylsulfatase B